MYGYSTEEMADTCFSGWCASRSQAYREAKEEYPEAKVILIGKWKKWIPHEYLFDVLERIQDECFSDTDQMEFEADTEQEEELLTMLQKTFIKWARKSGFKPMYIDGSTIVKYRAEEGEKQ